MTSQNSKTGYKFVVVINKKIESGVAINTAAHMVACLVARASEEDRKNMMIVDYLDATGVRHPVSALSLIVLRAKNSNQIRKARELAIEKEVHFVDFLETMTGDTYVEQMERTNALKEEELDYWGIALFGLKKELDPVTGKFSMWK
jgi:hypothetical protein